MTPTIIYDPRTMHPETEAQRAMWLSVRVGDRLRAAVGIGGDVLGLWAQLPKMFPDGIELAEARRLLELSARIRKRGLDYDALATGQNGDNRMAGYLGSMARDGSAGEPSGSQNGRTAQHGRRESEHGETEVVTE